MKMQKVEHGTHRCFNVRFPLFVLRLLLFTYPVQLGGLVLLVNFDHPADVRLRQTRGPDLAVLIWCLDLGVLATFASYETVPDRPTRTSVVTTQFYSRILPISPCQQPPDSSIFAWISFQTVTGKRRFGSSLWTRFRGRADPFASVLQVDGEISEPFCHGCLGINTPRLL